MWNAVEFVLFLSVAVEFVLFHTIERFVLLLPINFVFLKWIFHIRSCLLERWAHWKWVGNWMGVVSWRTSERPVQYRADGGLKIDQRSSFPYRHSWDQQFYSKKYIYFRFTDKNWTREPETCSVEVSRSPILTLSLLVISNSPTCIHSDDESWRQVTLSRFLHLTLVYRHVPSLSTSFVQNLHLWLRPLWTLPNKKIYLRMLVQYRGITFNIGLIGTAFNFN